MGKKLHREYLSHHDTRKKHTSSKFIGKTIASYSYPSTIDGYWFIVNHNTILNTFDFVTVNNLYESKTIGLVQDIRALPSMTFPDSPSNNEFSDNNEKKNDMFVEKQLFPPSRHGVIAASVAVIGNTGIKSKSGKLKTINLPILAGMDIRFSTSNEILFALGIPKMGTPIAAGIIEMSNGLQVPVSLDITYLAGPDTAHMNVAGISGNKKTSYALFLLQSLCQKFLNTDNTQHNRNAISAIIFNTKADDLLHLHRKAKHVEKDTKRAFQNLDMKLRGFKNVTYFLPRGADGMPNSLHIPDHFKTYSFELKDIYDRLDLLFSSSSDLADISPLLDYIHENWPLNDKSQTIISNWTDLTKFDRYPKFVTYNRNLLQDFITHIHRFRKSPLFVDKKSKSTYLGNEIKNIKPNEVFVIDISAISSVEEQAFVIGDVFKSLNELHSIGSTNRNMMQSYTTLGRPKPNRKHNTYEEKTPELNLERRNEIPKYLVVFLDEINRFIPKSHLTARLNPVPDQIMRFVIEGRSRCNILLSAQQFKSETDVRFQENIGLHVIGKLGRSELLAEPYYSMIEQRVKQNIARLERGEMIIVHPAFRHPVKVWFPGSSYQRP